MGRDLFGCNLDEVRFQDLAEFIAIDLPEGTRLDYKDQIPQSLGDTVAAFSNTFGGLIIVGVQKNRKTPSTFNGVARPTNSDLKTAIVNKIVSTVQPRPDFAVAVVPHAANPDHDVAVIRVEEGNETPYMFLPNKKVSIRVEDKNETATLADLEQLFGRRGMPLGAHLSSEERNIQVFALHSDGKRYQSDTYLQLWLAPSRPLPVLLDRRFEQSVLEHFQRAFPEFRDLKIADRHSSWFEILFKASNIDFEARWRVTLNVSWLSVIGTA